MSDQPKPTGEWTADDLIKLISYEPDREDFEQASKAITAALADERETAVTEFISKSNYGAMIRENQQLRDKLAAAQAAIQRHKRAYGHTLDFPDDTTALDAVIAAAQKPLIDAVFPKGTEDGEPTVQEAVKAIKETRGDLSEAMKQLRETDAAQKPLVDALKFYADQENYVNDVLGLPDGSSEVEGSSEINQDGGMKASDALAKVKETKCHK